METYLNTEEAAALLRTPVSTLRYWRHRGEGPPSARVGRRVLYRRADVLAWVDAQFDQAEGRPSGPVPGLAVPPTAPPIAAA